MEGLRMDYRFTAALILMLTILAFFGGPAHSRNEYLQNSDERCGEFETRVTQSVSEDQQLQALDRNFNNGSRYLSLTYRKYLGVDCKSGKENRMLKQQLELMKMCGRVNSNPSLAYNSNFDLLTSKCRGVTPTSNRSRPENSGSLWDELKDEYKKENPDVTLMGDKFLKPTNTLKKPPKDYILPIPKPTND